jgi:hypothetical protein
MRIICAWCNQKMGGSGSLLSHGICGRCMAELKQPVFEFMRTVPSRRRSGLGQAVVGRQGRGETRRESKA